MRRRKSVLGYILYLVTCVAIGAVLGVFIGIGYNIIFGNHETREYSADAEEYPEYVAVYEPTDSDYYYAQLNGDEKAIYAGIYDTMKNRGTKFRVRDIGFCTLDTLMSKTVYALLYDHPELFWMRGYACHTEYSGDLKMTVNVTLNYYDFWEYSSNPERYVTEIEDKVKEVASLASGLDGDYEKAKFFYKYLIDHTEYDNERLAESEKTYHSASCMLIYTPYGCLVEGKAVCAGYAKAFQLLCKECGIDCSVITGDSHAWNCVKLDGDYYFVDPTWGDGKFIISDSVVENTVNYEYFCMDRETLDITHEVDESLLYAPVCESDKYDYFVYNGYEMETFTFIGLADIINAQSEESPAIVRFKNAISCALAELCCEYNTGFPEAVGADSVVYIENDDKLILYFFPQKK